MALSLEIDPAFILFLSLSLQEEDDSLSNMPLGEFLAAHVSYFPLAKGLAVER